MRTHHKSNAKINSPLGSFPQINSARVLDFDADEGTPRTQGNSKGAVNSPKVTTGATFMCNICDNHFETKDILNKHKSKEHIDNSSKVRNVDSYKCDMCNISESTEDRLNKHKTEVHIGPVNIIDDVLNNDMEDEDMLVEESIDTEDAILARELELMVYQYKVVGTKENCHECAISKEVVEYKETLLKEEEKLVEDAERKLKIAEDEKKVILTQNKKKWS